MINVTHQGAARDAASYIFVRVLRRRTYLFSVMAFVRLIELASRPLLGTRKYIISSAGFDNFLLGYQNVGGLGSGSRQWGPVSKLGSRSPPEAEAF